MRFSSNHGPLFGKRVLVTRPHDQAKEFITLLEQFGAKPIAFPVITIAEPSSWGSVDIALERLKSYDSIIFTSSNGVQFFFRRFFELGYGPSDLEGIQIHAVGPNTAKEIRNLGIQVDLVPIEFRAESLVEALSLKGIQGKRFLHARAMIAREIITEEIVRRGGYIDIAIAYRTVKCTRNASLKKLFLFGEMDVVTFTSPSAVSSLLSILGKKEILDLFKNCKVACIGPVTAEAAIKSGIEVNIMPREYTIQSLTEAIVDYFKSQSG